MAIKKIDWVGGLDKVDATIKNVNDEEKVVAAEFKDIKDTVNENADKQGDLALLTTIEKTNLVGAVNEVNYLSISSLNNIQSVVENGKPFSDYYNSDFTGLEISSIPTLPVFFTNNAIYNGFKLSSGNTEFYFKSRAIAKPKAGQYMKWEYLIYVEAGDYPPTLGRTRAFVFRNGASQVNYNSDEVSFIESGVYKVKGTAFLDFTEDINDFWLENVWESGDVVPSGDVYFSDVRIAYYNSVDFSISPNIRTLNEKVVKMYTDLNPINSILTGGSYNEYVSRNFTEILGSGSYSVRTIDETFLNSIDVENGITSPLKTNGNSENYFKFTDSDFFTDKGGQYLNYRLYTYTAEENKPPKLSRLFFSYTDGSGSKTLYAADGITITQENANVYRIDAKLLINISGSVTDNFLGVIWEAADIPSGNDYSITGLSAAWHVNNEDINVVNDWMIPVTGSETRFVTLEGKVEKLENESSFAQEVPYNNTGYNRSNIATFLDDYVNKRVDDNNQLTVTVVGDSIIGRLKDGEMSLTPGEENGYFPPNMWQQLITYKLLEFLQWNTSDVQYFNLMASEYTKVGTWNNELNYKDNTRVYRSSLPTDSFEITVSGVKFAKVLWFYNTSSTTNFNVLVNGVAPSTLGINGGDSFSTDAYNNKLLKWANNIWSGLDENTTYTFKFTNDGSGTAEVWGMEFWKNPRINVINAGEGGKIAAGHNADIQKFSNPIYNSSLLIHELPVLNDSYASNFDKGGKNPDSAVVAEVDKNFIWALQDGTYVNYDNIELKEGEYCEYSSSEGSWVRGSRQVDALVNAYNSNIKYLEKVAECGTPCICMTPHKTTNLANRPWQTQMTQIVRTWVNRLGMGFFDMDYKYVVEDLDIASGVADGTHLTDIGVDRYIEEIYRILNPSLEMANGEVGYSKKTKKGDVPSASSRSVDFDLRYLEIPEVKIYPYNDGSAPSFMYVDSVTEEGFTVVGTGAFKWESNIK